MIDTTVWLKELLAALDETFGSRVWFVGLQGSYARGEATDSSDLDVVVILDRLQAEDLKIYRELLDCMPHRQLVCGFFSGKEELLRWEPSDLFQFYYDTQPIRGSLDALLTLLDETAVKRAIKIGACNLYHGCVHNQLHDRSDEILRGLYKAAVFVVQAIVFLQTKAYVRGKQELLAVADAEERDIVETFLHLKRGDCVDFDAMSEYLMLWARKWIIAV